MKSENSLRDDVKDVVSVGLLNITSEHEDIVCLITDRVFDALGITETEQDMVGATIKVIPPASVSYDKDSECVEKCTDSKPNDSNGCKCEVLQWWGYLHIDGTVHVKRYFDDKDIEDARESDFVRVVAGPITGERDKCRGIIVKLLIKAGLGSTKDNAVGKDSL